MSEVVRWSVRECGIAVVAMEDRESRNTFSPGLIAGLQQAFDAIARDPAAKVVVLHGYDNYFCCGGTKEELVAIHEGTMRFSDEPFYDLPLRCELPVIAAMQGHALGGGLVLGCYADMMVLAEESMYGAVFMKYGFTPGMGGTYIVPERFGSLLGNELLFTARNYFGRDLLARGIPARVVRKAEVIAVALALAEDLADKPRLALVELKRHLAERIRRDMPPIIRAELAMHEVTFGQSEVRDRIDRFFIK